MTLRLPDTRMDRAFTLLELLAVIILISLMTLASSTAYRTLATGARQGAAETLLAALESTRSDAVLRNEPWPILFRKGSQFTTANSFNEYGLLQPVAGATSEIRRVMWFALPNGAWLYSGTVSMMAQGTNALGAAQATLSDLGVKVDAEDAGASVCSIIFGEVGEVTHPESPTGPLYLAVAEGNPDATDGTPISTPDIIEIRPGSGRCQLITP